MVFNKSVQHDRCRGTVALVHVECLERWLTESGRTRCELCGYRYATKRVPRYSFFRSVVIWFHTVIATRQVRIVGFSLVLISFEREELQTSIFIINDYKDKDSFIK